MWEWPEGSLRGLSQQKVRRLVGEVVGGVGGGHCRRPEVVAGLGNGGYESLLRKQVKPFS